MVLNRLLKMFKPNNIPTVIHKYTCDMCKTSHYKLPMIMGVDYVYQDEFEIGKTHVPNEYKIYGYVVESRFRRNDGTFGSWENQWNHKIYLSEGVAIEALIQFRNYNQPHYSRYEYRIVPMYNLPKSAIRNIKIKKILKK